MAMDNSKIYLAIKANKVENVRNQLKTTLARQSTGLRRKDGSTLLHAIIQHKASPVILELLLSHIDFTTRDVRGNSMADLMFEGDYPEEGEKILTEHIKTQLLEGDINRYEMWLQRGWHIWPFNIPQAKLVSQGLVNFIEKIPDIQRKVEDLHKAIQEGNHGEVKNLMKNENIQLSADRTGLPPLHKAIVWDQVAIAEDLFSFQPEALRLQDHMGRTPLHYAAGSTNFSEMYQAMKDAGGDEEMKDVTGNTPENYHDNHDLLKIENVRQELEDTIKKPMITTKTSSKPTPRYQKPYIPPVLGPRGSVAPPTSVEGRYAAAHVAAPLAQALAELVIVQPHDPIEYLAHWLYKYHDNEIHRKEQILLSKHLHDAEERKEREIVIRQNAKAEMRQIQEEERRVQQLEEEVKQKREQEELQRKAKEAALQFAQRPNLETLTEEEGEDDAARGIEKDFYGRTELHKMAATPGSDLISLLNQGHSLGEKNGDGKTARDVAVEKDIQEHVKTIDEFVKTLITKEKFDQLEQLILDGYDQWEPVIGQMQDMEQSEGVKKFLSSLTEYQTNMTKIFEAAQRGNIADLEQTLEKKKLVQARDKSGHSALHLAVLCDQEGVVEYLLTNFPDTLKSKDNLNRTALHYSMALSESITKLLLDKGADSKVRDAKQKTVYFYKDHPEDIKALKQSLPLFEQTNQDNSDAE